MTLLKKSPLQIAFLTLLATAACLARQEKPGLPAILALVNGTSIREDDFNFRLNLEKAKYGPEALKTGNRFSVLKQEILKDLVRTRVLVEWGHNHGIVLTDEELGQGLEELRKGYTEREFETMLEEKKIPFIKWREAAIEQMTAQKVIRESLRAKLEVSPRELQEYYRAHTAQFKVGERVQVRHIVTDSPEKADHIHALLRKGENFAKLAIMHSLSPDRASGGELEPFARGTHPKEFDEAAFDMKPGEISPVVKSPYGYHIFKLINKLPEATLPFEEVEQEIYEDLQKKKLNTVFEPWYEGIAKTIQIQVMTKTLEKIRLED